jgi:hypothetical protein
VCWCVCGCERNSVAKTICLVPVEKCVKNSKLGTHTSFFSYFLKRSVNTLQQRGLNTKRPTLIFFLGPTKPLPSYGFDRQACARDTVLVKSREMTSRSQTLPWWLGGGGVKTTENKIHWPGCACSSLSRVLYYIH